MTNVVSKAKAATSRAVDGLTLGYIKAVNALKERPTERGDIVQTIIIIALFVGVTIAVTTILFPIIQDAAQSTGDCIAGASDSGINGSGAC